MKKTRQRWNSILWIEGIGFSFLILMSWLTEVLRIPYYLFDEPFVSNWHRAALRTVVIILIWICVHVMTMRLLKRLYYLEGFLRICSWCRKVNYKDQWLTMENYFKSQFSTTTSHGMCPDCLKLKVDEIKSKENPPEPKKFF